MSRPVPVFTGDGYSNTTTCPTCGMAVRIVRRVYDDQADHYEALWVGEDLAKVLPPQNPETAAKLKELRKGKKTVAIVGLAITSCSHTPFDDPDVEIWGLNEAHAFPQWFKRADRWFQIHATESWRRQIAKRDVRGHFEWLKTNPMDIPIYMQYPHPLIPKSVGYPLHEVVGEVFKNFRRGDEKVKYFTSTFCYEMGIAILEKFERIEIYGFEFADQIEYVKQKAAAEFWTGFAMGRDIEIYTPPHCQMLYSELYGGNEQGAGW